MLPWSIISLEVIAYRRSVSEDTISNERSPMSDDYEERIREDWYYTYKAWDAADDRRRAEREHEITRLGVEGARLGRETYRSEGARQLQEPLDRFFLNKKHALNQIDGLDALGASPVPLSTKTWWLHQLEAIDPRNPKAKVELESLLGWIKAFKSCWIEADVRASPVLEDPFRAASQKRRFNRYTLPLNLQALQDEEQKRGSEKVRNDYLKATLESIESSLKLLDTLCEAVQRCAT